ncbi:MAG: hypothetical protein JNK72_16795 [Myxococcales bacterium]|nr:hypothetical protein [Myxococcales bacterium]
MQLVAVGCDDSTPSNPSTDSGAADVAGDSNTPTDNGTPTDRGTPVDNGTPVDSGNPEDGGGPVDSGNPEDAGQPADAGQPEDVQLADVPVEDAGPVDAVVEDAANADVVTPTDNGTPTDGGNAECRTSSDCASSMGGPVCDTAAGRCVPCTTAEDVCPVGNYCNMNRCVAGCRNAMDCTGGARCDLSTRMCVGCLGDDDCAPGSICRNAMCVPGCSTSRPCGAGQTCCNAMCVDTQTSAANCGACGTAVGMGQTCCAGAGVNTATDTANCGACGTRCAPANGTATCANGTCGLGACNAGFGNCDMMAANGCETDTSGDANNCGACGTRCTAGANAAATCAMGTCGQRCNDGFGNCDMMAGNGCETNLATSVANCGACGTVCPARANAAATCAASACGIACNTGFGDCDSNTMNGCETALTTDVANCGTCGRTCSFANGTAACRAGACALATCNAGFGNCDNNAANGCETNTGTDRANCGACGRACASNAICFDGTCRSVCSAPLIVCGSTCINPTNDITNCGRCGNACPAMPANGVSACTNSACTVTCTRGFGNCDNMVANGCETNLLTSTTSCGACGRACTFANASATCVNGACAMGACNTGFADCDGNPANGCETPVSGDVNNCGACGNRCAFPSAAATCAMGVCTMGACAAGTANCDMNNANGCETNIASNTLNCGACGRSCMVGQACAPGTGGAGACVNSCPAGTTFCAGGCINLNNDRNNCGTCGTRCGNNQNCVNRACVNVAPSNDGIGGAAVIPLTNPTVDFGATTVNATTQLTVPCVGMGVNRGADVFYRFTLTRREIILAETNTATFDTVLYLLNGAGQPITASQTPGDTVCNDDANFCSGAGTTSVISTVLNPGTYYLVLAGYANTSGTTNIHFEHLSVGTSLTLLPQGNSTQTGIVTGASNYAAPMCGGAGAEASFWWRTCSGTGAGTLSADTCGSANFDTVLSLANGNGFAACNDNSCDLASRLAATYTAASRLHAMHVDSFSTTLPTGGGRFTVRVSRP